jgi:hypothetical protein
MTDIIARVRLMIADTSGTPVFADQSLQDTLDTRRTDVRYMELIPAETISGPPTAGTVTWLDFYAPVGWWENDEQLLSNIWAPLTPTTSDRVVGHWTMATNQYPPVYIVGKYYDLFAAAADTLEEWIGLLKLQYDTVHERDRFLRNQRIVAMEGMIAKYRAKQMPQTATLTRDDTHPGSDVNWYLRPFSAR